MATLPIERAAIFIRDDLPNGGPLHFDFEAWAADHPEVGAPM